MCSLWSQANCWSHGWYNPCKANSEVSIDQSCKAGERAIIHSKRWCICGTVCSTGSICLLSPHVPTVHSDLYHSAGKLAKRRNIPKTKPWHLLLWISAHFRWGRPSSRLYKVNNTVHLKCAINQHQHKDKSDANLFLHQWDAFAKNIVDSHHHRLLCF